MAKILNLNDTSHSVVFMLHYIAKLSSVKLSTSQIELRLALLSQYTHPPHPDKYIWASSRLPWMMKLCMEVLNNKTRTTSQQTSRQLVSQKCRG